MAMILSLLFVVALSDALISQYAIHSQFNALRERLMVIAQISVLTIDPDVLQAVPLNRGGIHSPEYQAVAEKLRKIKQTNPVIKYIYTMKRTGKVGSWQFVVDPEPDSPRGGGPTSYPGDAYDSGRFPEMLKAVDGPAADKRLEIDEWGPTLSGYAPILNDHGQAVAILGVDMAAQDVYIIQNKMHQRLLRGEARVLGPEVHGAPLEGVAPIHGGGAGGSEGRRLRPGRENRRRPRRGQRSCDHAGREPAR